MMIGSYSSSLNTNNGLVKFEVSFADKKFGAQNFYTSTFPTQYEETETYRGQLSWEKSKENLEPVNEVIYINEIINKTPITII